ncbi:MAG: DUF5320 domain-containing protein [Dehalococcoidia bacterium]
MPGFDGTGPLGMGPMTGGGRGFCNPWGAGRGWFGRGRGFGRGPGFGRGRGMGWRGPAYGAAYGAPYDTAYAPPAMSREQEMDMLQNQAQAIKEELEDIESRIKELQQNQS